MARNKQKHGNTKTAKPEDTTKVEGNLTPREPPVVSHVTPSPEQTNSPCQCCKDRTPKWKNRLEVAAFVVGVAYTFFACVQWLALRASNVINRQSLEAVQRAYITFSGIEQSRNNSDKIAPFWVLNAKINNSGTTPAASVINYSMIDTLAGEPTEEEFSGANTDGFIETVIGPKTTLSLTQHTKWEVPDIFSGPIGDLNNFPPKGLVYNPNLFVWGWVVYRDILPRTKLHLTEYCAHLMTARTNKKIVELFFKECKLHNCADDQCTDYDAITNFAAVHTPKGFYPEVPKPGFLERLFYQ